MPFSYRVEGKEGSVKAMRKPAKHMYYGLYLYLSFNIIQVGRYLVYLNFFIISFFATHMRALFPYMNIGIVKRRQTSCIIPIATKTVLLPLCSNHSGKNKDQTRPCKISVHMVSHQIHMVQ